MKKLLVVAALAGGMFSAAPITTAEAAAMPLKCLFFPLLQADCRDAIKAAMTSAHDAAMMSADAAKPDSSKFVTAMTKFPSGPWWWTTCVKAPEGSKFLYVCE